MSKKELFEQSEEATNETQQIEKQKKEKTSIFKASNVSEILSIVGLNDPEVKNALAKIKKNTIYGVVDGYSYETLIKAKIYEYVRLGIARRVYNMMIEQADRNANVRATQEDLLIILSEMARLEVEFGLKPIVHVIPVANQLYIKADGFLYYAKNSKKLKQMTWEDKELDGGAWQSICRVKLDTGEEYEGIAIIKPNPKVKMDDPREKARTKAMRRALRRAFAIGASDEPLEAVEEIERAITGLDDVLDETLDSDVESEEVLEQDEQDNEGQD